MSHKNLVRRFGLAIAFAGGAALLAYLYFVSPADTPDGGLVAIALALALSTFVSEDLALMTGGALVAQGRLDFWPAVGICIVGIFVGDVLLYMAGRFGGGWLLGTRVARRFISPEAVERASSWMGDRTFSVVLLSRFTPGLRLPVYVAAGVLSRDFRKFSLALLLAAVAWTPLLVGASGAVSGRLTTATSDVWTGIALPAGLLAGVLFIGRKALTYLSDRRRRRLVAGAIRQKLHWEFWPVWLSYIPVAIYIVWLGVRHRSLTLFTLSNPGIPCGGGFAGEPKSQILSGLGRGGAPIGRFTAIEPDLSLSLRVSTARRFLEIEQLDYPVVLKPDCGERGSGVAVIRSLTELTDYLEEATERVVIQEYVGGLEFGIFYHRSPSEQSGHILSITRKEFPHVVGDGTSTLEDLVLADSRAVMLAATYLDQCPRDPQAVIPDGEVVQLVEIGAHCRGTIFLDGGNLETAALLRAIDGSAQALPGFYFGRFDVRSESVEALREGKFRILELNGVTSEASHIYDPRVSVIEAYRTLFKQWRIAFQIGELNRQAGAQPESIAGLIRIVRRQRAGADSVVEADVKQAWAAKTPVGNSA